MTATALLDVLEDQSEPAQRLALALIDGLLSEAEALRGLDGMMFPENPDESARRKSRQVAEAWHGWIDQAEGVLRRLARMRLSPEVHERAAKLQTRWGHARALMQMEPEQVERARSQVRAGETSPGEEVRRELQLRAGGGRPA